MAILAGRKRKPRIREELLPVSAKYATIDDREYVMIPVEDFGEWYEDVEDGALVRHARDNPEPLIPAEQVREEARGGGKRLNGDR